MRRLLVLPPVLVVLLCGFLAISEEETRLVTVDAIRMGVDGEGQTRIVLDLDQRPRFLVGPVGQDAPEIVVHLEGGRFEMTDGGTGTKDGTGIVERVSYGPNLVRISLAEAGLPVRSFVLPPAGKIDHFRLVIDLEPASQAEFLQAAAAFKAPLDQGPEPAAAQMAEAQPESAAIVAQADAGVMPPSLKPDSPELPQIVEAEELPVVAAPVRTALKTKPLIVLDPGHGGHEPGSIGQSGTEEEDITLAHAKALAAVLKARGYDVELTRTDDTYVKHEDRIGLARERHADLFMSIHADSHSNHTLRGGSVYTLSQRRSDRLESEIRSTGDFVLYDVEVSQEDGVGDILLDLAQSTTRQNSDRLANALIRSMRPTMPLVKNPKRQGGLLVLLSPDVPAVLVELAFISNHQDEANLTSPAWRSKAATAIADGIDAYFDEAGLEQRLAGGSSSSG